MMKKYKAPELDIILILNDDIITTSPGTETSKRDENDGIWDLNVAN